MSRQPVKSYKNKPYKSPYTAPGRIPRPVIGSNPAYAGDTKYFDTNRDAGITACTTVWAAGTIADPTTKNTLLSPIKGTGISDRIGREVHVLGIKLRGTLRIPPQITQNAADGSTTIRVMLVQDKQTNAAQMTSAALMADGANAATTVLSFQSLDNFGRFQVLKDKIIQIGDLNLANDAAATGNIVQQGASRQFKMFYKFKKPIPVRFNGTNGGTVADIVDNSFHVIAGCSDAAYVPSLTYSCRVSYKG